MKTWLIDKEKEVKMKSRMEKNRSGVVGLSLLLLLFIMVPFYPTSAYLSDQAEQQLGISLTLGNLKEDILDPSSGNYADEIMHLGELRPAQNLKSVTFRSNLKNTGSLDSNHAFKIEIEKPSNLSDRNFENEKKNITATVKKDGQVIFQGKLSELLFGEYSPIKLESLEPQEEFTVETTLTYDGKRNSVKRYDLEVNVTVMAMQTNKMDPSSETMFYDYSRIRHRVSVYLKKDNNGFEHYSTDGHFTYTLSDLDMFFGKNALNSAAVLNYGRIRLYIPDDINPSDLRFTTAFTENSNFVAQLAEMPQAQSGIAAIRFKLQGAPQLSNWEFAGKVLIEHLVDGVYVEYDTLDFSGEFGRKGKAKKLYLSTDTVLTGTEEENPITLQHKTSVTFQLAYDSSDVTSTHELVNFEQSLTGLVVELAQPSHNSAFLLSGANPYTIYQSSGGEGKNAVLTFRVPGIENTIILTRTVIGGK
jgi:hypothetical protein